MLREKYTEGQYLQAVPDWHVGDSGWKSEAVLRMIERHRLKPKRLVDIGCGAGEILALLQKELPKDVELRGYDISPQAIELATPKGNDKLQFVQEDFLNREGTSVDLALLLDVFEHVPDYLGFLTSLRGRADRVIFHIPLDSHVTSVARGSRHMLDMRSQYGHLHYFTPETALATLEDCGFTVMDHFYTWDNERVDFTLNDYRERPASCLIHNVDKWLYRIRPDLAARFRPNINLMVLVESRSGSA